MFILQATLQPAADPGNGARGQRQVLILGHADVDRTEFAQKPAAAQDLPADGDAAADAGFVADPDLTQFQTRAQRFRQLLNQFAEIHPPVGGEQNGHQLLVEGKAGVEQLHRQFHILDHLAGGAVGGFGAGVVLGGDAAVVHGGDPLNPRDVAGFFRVGRAAGALLENLHILQRMLLADHAIIAHAQLQCAVADRFAAHAVDHFDAVYIIHK
ncbi:hypothetical protein SDC9_103400 [bioreactor metagenome]|uniref:Uncharacterized protein n=1 Tax=bioreactor metagenome TaxID=1076179 RepID=A0A645AWB3_9ZZZZ